MATILFGPAGIGPIKDIEETFEEYQKLGLKAAEIPFTYSIFIKTEKVAVGVGKGAKKRGIYLSVHAPYWINLNSKEKEKINASKQRILRSAEIGHYISKGMKKKVKIVFHSGFYSGMEREEAYKNIKKEILDMLDTVKKNKWDVELCPEVMGKKNVFGSIEEISKLVKETNCGFCIDFAHTLARYGKYPFELIKQSFPEKNWHCHFSGIEYTEKAGERKHKKTDKEEWVKVLDFLKDLDKNIIIINEADNPVEDSVEGLNLS